MSYLNKNISRLADKSISVLEEITYQSNIKIIESEKGMPTLIYKKKYIHSKIDPVKEAEILTGRIKDLDNVNTVIILGFGLGYHFNNIVKNVRRGANIVVIEKEPEILKTAFENIDFTGLNERTIFIIPGITEMSRINSILNGKVEIFEFFPETRLDVGFYNEVKNYIKDSLKGRLIDLSTTGYFGPIWFRNTIFNLRHLNGSYTLSDFADLNKNKRGILLAPGRSIEKIINKLKLFEKDGVIAAVSPVVKYLIKNQIIPDIVISIDGGYYNNFYFRGIDTSNMILVTDLSIDYHSLSLWEGQIVFFNMDFPFKKFSENIFFKDDTIPQVGTVSAAAIHILEKMGCNEIYLAGQDFGSKFYNMHCPGGLKEYLALRNSDKINSYAQLSYSGSNNKYINSFNGEKIRTDDKYMVYRNWFGEYVKNSKTSFYCLTGDSAYIDNVNLISFDDIKESDDHEFRPDMSVLKLIEPDRLNACINSLKIMLTNGIEELMHLDFSELKKKEIFGIIEYISVPDILKLQRDIVDINTFRDNVSERLHYFLECLERVLHSINL